MNKRKKSVGKPILWHEISIARVTSHAPHCLSCNDEIIAGSHVLVPMSTRQSRDNGYSPLCFHCALDLILMGVENNECQCEQCQEDQEESEEDHPC